VVRRPPAALFDEAAGPAAAPGLRVEVTYPAARSRTPLDGRLLFLVSADTAGEPRFQISDGPNTQLVFGVDVDGWVPGDVRVLDAGAFGYPLRSLANVPAGRYRRTGAAQPLRDLPPGRRRVLKLPPDQGEGQQWNRKPGNLYSTVRTVALDPSRGVLRLTLDTIIPAIAPPPDTRYVKHLRMRSERLSKFWGRDMYLGAHVLLPEGFDSRPDARYPLVVNHGHFAADVDTWREAPPDRNLKPDFSERFGISGYNRVQQQAGYDLFRWWTGRDAPRVLLVQIQHATPYYDDSYAVNSGNTGPYGDAIQYELIPEIERRFRGIGQGWARATYGGSTGGWEALAVQTFYPDEYNGAWVACPDPVDFRAYTVVDLYGDANAYRLDSRWKRTPRPGHRDSLGPRDGHARGDEPQGARVRHARPERRAVGRVAGHLLAPGARRLPGADLEQAHRRDRPGRGAVVARPLRPVVHPPPRLGDARAQAARQAAGARGRHGQLLPEQRGLPPRELPQDREPAGRGDGDLRRPRRALLERRPDAAQRAVAPALPADGAAVGGRAHAAHRARRRRHRELALLTGARLTGARRNARRPAASGLAAGRRAHWGGSPEGLF
jgi:hypothetical protein